MFKEGLVALIIVAVVGVGAVALFRRAPKVVEQIETAAESASESVPTEVREMEYSITEVLRHKYVYQDLRMELTGVIRNWLDKRTFVISDPTGGNAMQKPPNMLVVNRGEFSLAENTPEGELVLGQRATVRLTGTIQIFVRADVESQLGIDLPDELVRGYANKPFLLVDTVELP